MKESNEREGLFTQSWNSILDYDWSHFPQHWHQHQPRSQQWQWQLLPAFILLFFIANNSQHGNHQVWIRFLSTLLQVLTTTASTLKLVLQLCYRDPWRGRNWTWSKTTLIWLIPINLNLNNQTIFQDSPYYEAETFCQHVHVYLTTSCCKLLFTILIVFRWGCGCASLLLLHPGLYIYIYIYVYMMYVLEFNQTDFTHHQPSILS